MRTLIAALWGLFLSPVAHAFDVEEFDAGLGEWAPFPAQIGQSSVPGWAPIVEGTDAAVRTSPSPTTVTYYWRLTRDIDLTDAAGLDADLEVRLKFAGTPYESARIEIGPKGSTKATDYTALWETNTPRTSPELVHLDLAAWEGKATTVRVVLKKPSNVVASTSGLTVYSIGVVLPPPPPPPPDPVILDVGSFNVQVFGRSKMGTAGVPEALVQTLSRYDLVLFQEIRDATGTAFADLVSRLNAATGNAYEVALSPRLGRTTSKEQYAYIYRVAKLDLIDAAVWPDPMDEFEREPYVARFTVLEGGFDFVAIGLHAAPDDAQIELGALAEVYDDVVGTYDDEDVVLMGDFNASCTYLSPSEIAGLEFRTDAAFSWWIGDAADTTTTNTVCAYDRILTTGDLSAAGVPSTGDVLRFDQMLGLSPDRAKAVSDHYPVRVLLDLGPGGTGP